MLRWALVVVTLAGALPPGTASAQRTQEHPTFDFVARGVPVGLALERLVNLTRIDLYYDTPLVEGKRSSCAVSGATSEELLRCVLRDTGLDFIRLSSGLYVVVERTERAPRYGRLRGVVVDAATGQPLPHAHVVLAEAETGTAANEAGFFAFSRLKPGAYRVTATYVGYRESTTTVTVPPGGDTEAELALRTEPVLYAPVVVDGLSWRLPSQDLGTASISSEAMRDVPAPGGPDVVRSLSTLLGVRVNDATADVHVQGGETGEHQVRLDGAPVFLPLSFASFAGPFSPFAIGRIDVHKAGFGVAQGSQISGVIDIEHDLSVPVGRQMDVQVDPLSLNGRASLRGGPEGGVQGTVVAAGRYALWDLYAPNALQSLLNQWNTPDPFLKVAFDRSTERNVRFDTLATSGNPGIGFRDVHVTSRLRFGLLKSLHSSLYYGGSHLGTDLDNDLFSPARTTFASRDDTTQTFRDQFSWRTGVAQSHFESVVGNRALLRVGARGSFYRVNHDYNVPDSLVLDADAAGTAADSRGRLDDGNRVFEVAAEATLDYVLGHRQTLRAGIELIRTGSQFDVTGTQRYPIVHDASSWRVALHAEDEIALTPGTTIEGGSRLTYLASHRRFFAEPRMAFRLDRGDGLLGAWSLRLSSGLYRQFVNQFDVSSRSPGALLSSTRFWLVGDATTRPPLAVHYAGEWLLKPSDAWTVRVEGYHKQQRHILTIDYAAGAESAGETRQLQQRDFVRSSRGSVDGVGVEVARELGPGRASARYEYSRAMRAVPELFGGKLRRAPWDEPHRLQLALDLMPWRNVTLLARWRGVWGRTWGFRRGYYDFLGAYESLVTDANIPPLLWRKILNQVEEHELRKPDQHGLPPIYQLDLSLAYTLQVAASTLQMRADVLNVLDHHNVAEWYLTYDPSYEETGFLPRAERPLLPRLMTLAVKLTI